MASSRSSGRDVVARRSESSVVLSPINFTIQHRRKDKKVGDLLFSFVAVATLEFASTPLFAWTETAVVSGVSVLLG